MTIGTEAVTSDWAHHGAFPVVPGVHRIPLPLPADGLRAVNVYVIEDGGRLTLVDGGWALPASRAALESALASLGAGLGDVRRFLVTHLHRDHYTQAIALRREFGATVSIGAGEEPAISMILSGKASPFAPQIAELLASGATPLVELLRAAAADGGPAAGTVWEAPDEWLAPRQEIGLADRTLRVLPTPGHTQGHVVFADEAAGLLFAGDHVLPHITPSIGFEPVRAKLPLGDYLQSLRLVRSLPDMRLLPAHGPVADSVHARVDALLAHHADRLDACLAAVAAGEATGYEVARALRWTRRARRLDDLDPVNQMLAVVETRAHLELLTAQGRLSASWLDGVACYSTPAAAGPVTS